MPSWTPRRRRWPRGAGMPQPTAKCALSRPFGRDAKYRRLTSRLNSAASIGGTSSSGMRGEPSTTSGGQNRVKAGPIFKSSPRNISCAAEALSPPSPLARTVQQCADEVARRGIVRPSVVQDLYLDAGSNTADCAASGDQARRGLRTDGGRRRGSRLLPGPEETRAEDEGPERRPGERPSPPDRGRRFQVIRRARHLENVSRTG